MRARAILAFGVIAISCTEIQGTRISSAPLNVCPEHPCDAFKGGAAKAGCQQGRCEISGGLSRFYIVVAVPETSFFAPGATYFITNQQLAAPRVVSRGCAPPNCLLLPDFGVRNGAYSASKAVAERVGLTTPGTLGPVPSRVSFVPLTETTFPGLPVPVLFTASRVIGSSVRWQKELPAGRYRRVEAPEPPWDKYLPPRIDDIEVKEAEQVIVNDELRLEADGVHDLDDSTPERESRQATFTRAEGLAGFRAWIVDPLTKQRVSVVKALSDNNATVVLDTRHQRQDDITPDPSRPATSALRNGLDMVLAPPADWIGAPYVQTEITPSSSTLGSYDYPTLSPPIQQNGVVADTSHGKPLGIPSRVTFTSQSIFVKKSEPRLHYTTTVMTDSAGRFTTVLPPGTYDVMADPAEGTSYSRFAQVVELLKAESTTLVAPKRAHVKGRAHVADGRPLAGARVLVAPSPTQTPSPGQSIEVAPRAETTTNDQGEYELSVDRGNYEVAVVPEPGTGLPRLVQVRLITDDEVDLGDAIVPAPFKLALTIREPRQNALPLPHAVVRIFAPKGNPETWVEVGIGITDALGKVEILLAD